MSKQDFSQGVAYAAAELERAYGATSYAWDILHNCGLTTAKELRAMKVDPYDRKVCLRVIKMRRQRLR